jgi:hypothetical protein
MSVWNLLGQLDASSYELYQELLKKKHYELASAAELRDIAAPCVLPIDRDGPESMVLSAHGKWSAKKELPLAWSLLSAPFRQMTLDLFADEPPAYFALLMDVRGLIHGNGHGVRSNFAFAAFDASPREASLTIDGYLDGGLSLTNVMFSEFNKDRRPIAVSYRQKDHKRLPLPWHDLQPFLVDKVGDRYEGDFIESLASDQGKSASDVRVKLDKTLAGYSAHVARGTSPANAGGLHGIFMPVSRNRDTTVAICLLFSEVAGRSESVLTRSLLLAKSLEGPFAYWQALKRDLEKAAQKDAQNLLDRAGSILPILRTIIRGVGDVNKETRDLARHLDQRVASHYLSLGTDVFPELFRSGISYWYGRKHCYLSDRKTDMQLSEIRTYHDLSALGDSVLQSAWVPYCMYYHHVGEQFNYPFLRHLPKEPPIGANVSVWSGNMWRLFKILFHRAAADGSVLYDVQLALVSRLASPPGVTVRVVTEQLPGGCDFEVDKELTETGFDGSTSVSPQIGAFVANLSTSRRGRDASYFADKTKEVLRLGISNCIDTLDAISQFIALQSDHPEPNITEVIVNSMSQSCCLQINLKKAIKPKDRRTDETFDRHDLGECLRVIENSVSVRSHANERLPGSHYSCDQSLVVVWPRSEG